MLVAAKVLLATYTLAGCMQKKVQPDAPVSVWSLQTCHARQLSCCWPHRNVMLQAIDTSGMSFPMLSTHAKGFHRRCPQVLAGLPYALCYVHAEIRLACRCFMLVAAKVDSLAQTLQGAKHQILMERRRVRPCMLALWPLLRGSGHSTVARWMHQPREMCERRA